MQHGGWCIGASAIAGLISLAAFSIQSITKFINFTQEFRNVLDDIKKRLKGLYFLKQVLDDIKGACGQLQDSQINVDTGLLETGLRNCQQSVERLTKYLENRSLQTGSEDRGILGSVMQESSSQ